MAGPAPLVHRVVPSSPRGVAAVYRRYRGAYASRVQGTWLTPVELRNAVTRLRSITGDEYALATRNVATDGISLLVNMEKVRVEDILEVFWAGESYLTIAGEFGVSPDAVEAVIRSATRRRAA
jgi:hypothetical protein